MVSLTRGVEPIKDSYDDIDPSRFDSSAVQRRNLLRRRCRLKMAITHDDATAARATFCTAQELIFSVPGTIRESTGLVDREILGADDFSY